MDSGDGSTPGSTPKSDRHVRTFTEDEEEWQEPEYAQYVLSDDDAGMWGDDDDEEEEDGETPKILVNETWEPNIPAVASPKAEDDCEADDEKDPNVSAMSSNPRAHRRHHSRPIFNFVRALRKKKEDGGDKDDGDEQYGDNSSSTDADDHLAVLDDSYSDYMDSDGEENRDIDNLPGSLDWDNLPPVPVNFVRDARDQPALDLDKALWEATFDDNSPLLTRESADLLAREHSLLLQAVWQLLAQREQVGVEGSVDDAENVWKKGPLKKMSNAVVNAWSVKYVELRKGNLVYYEDRADQGRKTIHLRQSECKVVESSQRGPGCVFEIRVEGSPTRYWAGRSEEERQSWIKAIQSAMIGDETRRPRELDLSPFQTSIDVFRGLRQAVNAVDQYEAYVLAVNGAVSDSESIQVPIQWLRDELKGETCLKKKKIKRKKSTPFLSPKSSIDHFWKTMRRHSFSVNGFVISRDSGASVERVIGSLVRCILEFDQAFDDNMKGNKQSEISELQSLSYAREILLSVLQGNEQDDCGTCVRHLLQGRNDIVEVSKLTEDDSDVLTRLEVSFAGDDVPDEIEELGAEYFSNWVMVARRKNSKSSVPGSKWKRRFGVLSGAVLSLYEAASPRPHGLRSQFVVTADTKVSSEEMTKQSSKSGSDERNRRYVVVINSSGSERVVAFDVKEDMEAWKDALLQKVAELENEESPQSKPHRTPVKMLAKGAERVIKGADGSIRGGIRVIRGAKDTGMKAMKLATTRMKSATDGIRGAVGRLRPNHQHQRRFSRPGLARLPSVQVMIDDMKGADKRDPTVQCVVHRSQTFVVRTPRTREQGKQSEGHVTSDVDDEDVWMTTQVSWHQAFIMSGGPRGGIKCGDVLIGMDFGNGVDTDEDGEWIGDIDVL